MIEDKNIKSNLEQSKSPKYSICESMKKLMEESEYEEWRDYLLRMGHDIESNIRYKK